MTGSIQHRISRVRPPRVQITYDVEIGNAIESKELPFVLGILADLSGEINDPLAKLKERKFVEINADNFNDIMSAIKPRVFKNLPNHLIDGEGSLTFEMNFESIDDFSPINIIKKTKELNELFIIRSHLKDLMTKLDGNDKLEALLSELIKDQAKRDEIKTTIPQNEAEAT